MTRGMIFKSGNAEVYNVCYSLIGEGIDRSPVLRCSMSSGAEWYDLSLTPDAATSAFSRDVFWDEKGKNATGACDLRAMDQLPVTVLKATAMLVTMASTIGGNLLVIVSVLRFERLRIVANSFILSMAFADLLVAILVMPFNASQEICGVWLFGQVTCNFFNANDVLFSTASLLHLCCISVDRYIAVTDPFHYEGKMTKLRVAGMLACVWGSSALLSHVPIHMGWYTTREQQERMKRHTNECTFEVNKAYGLISSFISFWTPALIMVFAYVKIFREAKRQERSIRLVSGPALPTEHSVSRGDLLQVPGDNDVPGCRSRDGSCSLEGRGLTQHRKKMQRENKAAKTLGIIMGAFLCCWLPFFTWYLTSTMCGERCHTPPAVIALLFWVGYLNSALNPLIYAFFNRDFRDAFHRLLRCRKNLISLSSIGSSGNGSSWSGSDCYACLCKRRRGPRVNLQMTSMRTDINELHYRPIVSL